MLSGEVEADKAVRLEGRKARKDFISPEPASAIALAMAGRQALRWCRGR